MLIHRSFIALILTTIAIPAIAQTTGVLAGQVISMGGAPLADATVQALLPDTAYLTSTAADGRFRYEGLPTGLYRLRVSHIGYRTAELAESWVRAGKTELVTVELELAVNELAAVEIRSIAPGRLDAVSSAPITVERSLRYPATFFDPARLAMSYAGVAGTNDEANHFSVRGNSPAANSWLLEGAEIVTPNHLTNAGTPNDLPTLTGGGTTILSAQMLGSSRLLTGGMAARYGNALGGIMDLSLRKGITDRRAYTVQAGLIGIDLSAEGPFKVGGRASYLINYRYSTLGLLGAMGVPLGDEVITFQDLAFTVDLPLGERSGLRLFGMGGNSSNRFDRKDSTEWEYDKDSRDIDYTAQVGAAGLSFHTRIAERAIWRTTVALSANEQGRTREDSPIRGLSYRDSTGLYERKLSAHSAIHWSIGARNNLRFGLSAVDRDLSKVLYNVGERTSTLLLRPYFEWSHDLTEALAFDLGVVYASYDLDEHGVPEPRFTMRWRVDQRHHVMISGGQRSQMPQLQSYYRQLFPPFIDNRGIGPILAQDASVRIERQGDRVTISATAFMQRLTKVPVDVNSIISQGTGTSMLNTWEGLVGAQLADEGKGENQGVELALERRFHRDWFLQVNGTWLQMQYTGKDGRLQPGRWDVGTIANTVAGREWAKQSEGRKRTWGVSGRINTTGGQRYTPVLEEAMPLPTPYSKRYNSTYRMDLRIYLKRERHGRTGMWALDLLNATNAQNEAYRYYDQRKGEVVTRYQLGLIPNLSYRVEF
ncbi:MAG: TonB-dependent receptor [Flavobacteriales bacterium]|nr:TonB-dependent receptor [Flavobacteriales bacterium]